MNFQFVFINKGSKAETVKYLTIVKNKERFEFTSNEEEGGYKKEQTAENFNNLIIEDLGHSETNKRLLGENNINIIFDIAA